MEKVAEEALEHYELLYIIPGSFSEKDIPEVVKKVDQLLTDLGGKIEATEEIGSQKLAYKIKKETYGYYVAVVFVLAKDKLSDLNEKLRLSNAILRSLIVKYRKKSEEELAQEVKIQEKITAKKEEAVKKELADAEKKEKEEKAPEPVKKEVVKPTKEEEKVSMEELDAKLDEILDDDIDI